MPDCHIGKGCVVGFTQKLNEDNLRISPEIIGVDIGCSSPSICVTEWRFVRQKVIRNGIFLLRMVQEDVFPGQRQNCF